MIDSSKISTIIFDLGGVILNLDYQLTVNAFEKIGLKNPEQYFSKKNQTSFFDDFETGTITPNEFRKELKKHLNANITNQQIDDAWNAMLLDFPVDRFDFLKNLKAKTQIFLLSNTNQIHMEWFKNYVNQLFGKGVFFNLFEVAYLSNEIGLRKPNVEIFDYVIKKNKLHPKATLFIDDSPQHLDGARKEGLQTHWLQGGEEITILLRDFLA